MLEEFEMEFKLEEGFGCRRNVYALSIRDLGLFKDKIGFNLRRKQEKLEGFVR